MKLLDCAEQNPKIVDMERIEKFDLKDISFLPKSKEASAVNENFDEISITHFMVNMFGREYVRKLMVHNDWPLWKKIWGFLLLLLYICFKLNLFVKFISRQIYQTKLTTLYKSTVDYSGIPIRCALELISQPENFPCIICCHAGKDRTGIVSAILLSICGFDRETIVDDYARSEFGLPVTHHEMKDYEEQGRYASRETMNQLLDHIDDKYGSMSKYLCSIGFPKESQLKLKRLLLNDIHIFCET
ncbi:uncharacterized protein LOC143445685 [Clavelina lepadiformis]|uniref:uncharacterized protein LOC143445685 n=1 Tax=Clavelina lepadiformis TaxID=159417 RepID=UPI00404193A9